MGPFRDPNAAFAAVIFGLLIVYVELLRPGLVIAGVTGLVLVMLGIASLSRQPVHPPWLLLIGVALALTYIDARFRLHGIAGVIAAILFAVGVRFGFEGAVRWPVTGGLSVPFILLTDWLLTIAIRARLNKLDV